MLRFLRFALLVVFTFLALGMVVGIAAPETGPVEKVALLAMLAGTLAAAVPVQRIGVRHA